MDNDKFNFYTDSIIYQDELKEKFQLEVSLSDLEECIKELEEENFEEQIKNHPEWTEIRDYNEN